MINARVACRSLPAPLIKLPELDHSALLCAAVQLFPVFLSRQKYRGAQLQLTASRGMSSTWPESPGEVRAEGTFHASHTRQRHVMVSVR